MTNPPHALDVLNQEFLEIRARLLQLAAALDRIDRAEGTIVADPRRQQIGQAIEVVGSSEPDRAKRVQLVFSRPYDEHWQSTLLRGEHPR